MLFIFMCVAFGQKEEGTKTLVPLDLVEELINPDIKGENKVQLLVGMLPEEIGFLNSIETIDVVGSILEEYRYGDEDDEDLYASTSITSKLILNADMRQAYYILHDAFIDNGWQSSSLSYKSKMEAEEWGFIFSQLPQKLENYLDLCKENSMLEIHLYARTDGIFVKTSLFTEILNRNRDNNICNQTEVERVPIKLDDKLESDYSNLPEIKLTSPEKSTVFLGVKNFPAYGWSEYEVLTNGLNLPTNKVSRASISTTLEPKEVRKHYDLQMQELGWKGIRKGQDGPLTWSQWNYQDEEKKEWVALIIVLSDNTIYESLMIPVLMVSEK